MMCLDFSIRKCRKELAALYEKKRVLEDKEDVQALPGSELDALIRQIDDLVEGDYSRAVFDHYSRKEPLLIRSHTHEEVQWRDAFGESFDKTTIGQRHSLVGLIEGGGKYRLK